MPVVFYECRPFYGLSEEDAGDTIVVIEDVFNLWLHNQRAIDMMATDMAARLGLAQSPDVSNRPPSG